MARKPKRCPSFFKVLIGDHFVNKLKIPPAFKENLKGNVPAQFTLKSKSGSSWQVTVQDEQGSYFFCGGWSNFVKDQGLELGDFIVFNLLGRLTFDSVIYTRTGCEKKISIAAKRKRGRPSEGRGVPHGCRSTRGATARRAIKVEQHIQVISDSEATSEHPSFVVVLKKYKKFSVFVPKRFAKETGLADKRRTVMKDSEGRMWHVNVLVDKTSQIRLGGGWNCFLRENRLVAGDKVLFQHISRGTGNAIHVEIERRAGDGRRGR